MLFLHWSDRCLQFCLFSFPKKIGTIIRLRNKDKQKINGIIVIKTILYFFHLFFLIWYQELMKSAIPSNTKSINALKMKIFSASQIALCPGIWLFINDKPMIRNSETEMVCPIIINTFFTFIAKIMSNANIYEYPTQFQKKWPPDF